jgi:uncharacterized protein YndB with AHSA1/START domain
MSTRAGGLALELKFVVEAPRERIFRMLTEPAALAKWWGPYGFTMPGIDLDLRVGGGYRFTMQPPGGDPFHLIRVNEPAVPADSGPVAAGG